MHRNDDLRNGGHPHDISTYEPEKAGFGSGFHTGTNNTHINTLVYLDSQILGSPLSQLNEFFTVRFCHIGKTWPPFVYIYTSQWVLSLEIDVIPDEHNITSLEGEIEPASSVGNEQGLYSHGRHNPNGKGFLLWIIALVVMETSLQGHDLLAAKRTYH